MIKFSSEYLCTMYNVQYKSTNLLYHLYICLYACSANKWLWSTSLVLFFLLRGEEKRGWGSRESEGSWVGGGREWGGGVWRLTILGDGRWMLMVHLSLTHLTVFATTSQSDMLRDAFSAASEELCPMIFTHGFFISFFFHRKTLFGP